MHRTLCGAPARRGMDDFTMTMTIVELISVSLILILLLVIYLYVRIKNYFAVIISNLHSIGDFLTEAHVSINNKDSNDSKTIITELNDINRVVIKNTIRLNSCKRSLESVLSTLRVLVGSSKQKTKSLNVKPETTLKSNVDEKDIS